MVYICAHCAEQVEIEDDVWLDSGTQLYCPKCGKPTVVDLSTPEERKQRYEAVGD